MDSEHMHVSLSHSESGGTDSQDSATQTPDRNNPLDQEHQEAEQPSKEASAASKRRRRRPTRSSAHQNTASEHPAEEAQDSGQVPEQHEPGTESHGAIRESRRPISAIPDSASAEPAWGGETNHEAGIAATSDLASTAPTNDLWQHGALASPSPATPEAPWGFQHWREQPPTEWNPFLPHAPAAGQTIPSEPAETPGDLELTSLSPPGIETALTGDEESMAPTPAEDISPEAAALPATPDHSEGKGYEPMRAPLSGVEVRPPRRYRFDRPSQAAREAQQAAAQPKPAAPPAARANETPASTAEAPSADNDLGVVIEREMTETPEVETTAAAAEDLARATQAALEEEVAEALEGLAQPEKSAGQASGTGSRRRRRRRSTTSAATTAAATPSATPAETPPEKAPALPPQVNASQSSAVQNYQVANGLQQIGQPQSPFAGPEPSSARGFGPTPRGVATPAERGVRMPRPERTIETSNISANQLAMIFTQAIQQQTDRLLTELRRSQGTPSMTVNFPPMPSNERIGIFVDVANLLYSARNMRIAIDFGRLLDFLRGNRRMVRAHAYCPTSPDPRAEQMFLDAVKGLGYRITTKNYKTFSSGAKKADLDLDLCMDIVRLVDAGAVDCISLVSGDSDFLPLLEYCSDHGVRVEVAAFDESTASILRQSCDLFINLSMVEEIRA